MIDPIIARWIANDPSDEAQRIREVLRPIMSHTLDLVGEFGRWSRRFDHRHMMRRKIRRIVKAVA